MTQNDGFSVAMSVYAEDKPDWFSVALDSIENQTVKPAQIVLVVDGPISETLQGVIAFHREKMAGEIQFLVIPLPENQGLGKALNIAIENCSCQMIARMDSDDIAVADRFEQQLAYFQAHPETDVLGGNISEFIEDITNIQGKRTLPTTHQALTAYMKSRSPFNHMTVMYRKCAVQRAGSYQDWFYNEDYYLWLRMYLEGAKFANTGTVLVHARVGKDMYRRRGGWKYFVSGYRLRKFMREKGIIGWGVFWRSNAKRFAAQVLLPNGLRQWAYIHFARSK